MLIALIIIILCGVTTAICYSCYLNYVAVPKTNRIPLGTPQNKKRENSDSDQK